MREIDKKIEKVLIDHKFELAQHREQMSVEKYHFNLFNVVGLINDLELRLQKQYLEGLKSHTNWIQFEIVQAIIMWAIILYVLFGGGVR